MTRAQTELLEAAREAVSLVSSTKLWRVAALMTRLHDAIVEIDAEGKMEKLDCLPECRDVQLGNPPIPGFSRRFHSDDCPNSSECNCGGLANIFLNVHHTKEGCYQIPTPPRTFSNVKEMAQAWKSHSAALIASSKRSERITGADLQTRVTSDTAKTLLRRLLEPRELIGQVREAIANLGHHGSGAHCGCKDLFLNRLVVLVMNAIGEYEAITVEIERDDRSEAGYSDYLRKTRFGSYSVIENAHRIFCDDKAVVPAYKTERDPDACFDCGGTGPCECQGKC